MKVKCPSCGKFTEYSTENSYRPFCSERCKILDLGAWADERYRMPVSEQESLSVNENPNGHEPSEPPPPKHQLN